MDGPDLWYQILPEAAFHSFLSLLWLLLRIQCSKYISGFCFSFSILLSLTLLSPPLSLGLSPDVARAVPTGVSGARLRPPSSSPLHDVPAGSAPPAHRGGRWRSAVGAGGPRRRSRPAVWRGAWPPAVAVSGHGAAPPGHAGGQQRGCPPRHCLLPLVRVCSCVPRNPNCLSYRS